MPNVGAARKKRKRGGAKTNGGAPQRPGRGAPEADRPRAEPARGGEPDTGRTGEGRSKSPLGKALQPRPRWEALKPPTVGTNRVNTRAPVLKLADSIAGHTARTKNQI